MSTTPKSSPATRASEKRRLSEGSLKIEFNTPNKKARRQSAPLNGSKLSAGAYKDHTCPSCNQDLRHRKLSKVNFQKHVDKCEKVYPFIVNDNECKFCGKTGRVGYIGNHILENHSPQMNDEEETAENRGLPDGPDKTPEPNAVKRNNKRKPFQSKIEPATPIKFDAKSSDEANEYKRIVAPTPSIKIECKFCHSNFAKGNLGKHEETCQKYHKYVKDLKCTLCDHKGFVSQNYAYQHLTKVHSSEIDGNSQKNDERNVEDNQDDESDDSKESESESEDESEKEANELVIDESCKDDSGESDDEENDKDEMNENLNENPDESPDEGPWAQCSHCARFIPDHKMQDHQKNCGEKKSEPIVEETEQIEDDDDEEPNSDENGKDLTTEEDGDDSGIITLDDDEDEEMSEEVTNETQEKSSNESKTIEQDIDDVFDEDELDEAQQNPIVTMPDEEPPKANQIKNEFVHGNYPLVKHAVQLKQEAFERNDFKNVPEDPNCIEQLHVCPVCQKYLPTAMMAMDHVRTYHNISKEHQTRLNLKIRRIDLESLSL